VRLGAYPTVADADCHVLACLSQVGTLLVPRKGAFLCVLGYMYIYTDFGGLGAYPTVADADRHVLACLSQLLNPTLKRKGAFWCGHDCLIEVLVRLGAYPTVADADRHVLACLSQGGKASGTSSMVTSAITGVTSSVASSITGVTSDKPSAARTRACDAIQVTSFDE